MKIGELKELYDRIFVERDKFSKEREQRYEEKFEAAKEAVSAAFVSSEKAIEKSEEALRDYKTSSNEFRAALNDYQKNMITRKEAETLFDSLRELIQAQGKVIGTLQIAEGREAGGAATIDRTKTQSNFIIALIISNGLAFMALIVSIFISMKS